MLDKKYNPQEVEKGKYEIWKEKGYFASGQNDGLLTFSSRYISILPIAFTNFHLFLL